MPDAQPNPPGAGRRLRQGGALLLFTAGCILLADGPGLHASNGPLMIVGLVCLLGAFPLGLAALADFAQERSQPSDQSPAPRRFLNRLRLAGRRRLRYGSAVGVFGLLLVALELVFQIPSSKLGVTLAFVGGCSVLFGSLAQDFSKPIPVPTNKCRACGYSLEGLALHIPCPECGKRFIVVDRSGPDNPATAPDPPAADLT